MDNLIFIILSIYVSYSTAIQDMNNYIKYNTYYSGMTLELPCGLSRVHETFPLDDPTWMINGEPIISPDSSSNCDITIEPKYYVNGNKSTLTIYNSNVKDKGEYCCFRYGNANETDIDMKSIKRQCYYLNINQWDLYDLLFWYIFLGWVTSGAFTVALFSTIGYVTYRCKLKNHYDFNYTPSYRAASISGTIV